MKIVCVCVDCMLAMLNGLDKIFLSYGDGIL